MPAALKSVLPGGLFFCVCEKTLLCRMMLDVRN